MFEPNKQYSKWDIYEILNVPKNQQRGAWDTGYREYRGNIYVFSNIGIPGRTGHDYNNYWDGDLFVWEAKTRSNINQPLIKKMLNPTVEQGIFLFTRTDDKLPFTFEGKIKVRGFIDSSPVKITWEFDEYSYAPLEIENPSRVEDNLQHYEGTPSKMLTNKYERNPLARRLCIEYHGSSCSVCGFNFYLKYGELGKGFIHVHHIVLLSSIKRSYVLDPEKDLVPVCPNCHWMIHRRNPAISIDELKNIILK